FSPRRNGLGGVSYGQHDLRPLAFNRAVEKKSWNKGPPSGQYRGRARCQERGDQRDESGASGTNPRAPPAGRPRAGRAGAGRPPDRAAGPPSSGQATRPREQGASPHAVVSSSRIGFPRRPGPGAGEVAPEVSGGPGGLRPGGTYPGGGSAAPGLRGRDGGQPP